MIMQKEYKAPRQKAFLRTGFFLKEGTRTQNLSPNSEVFPLLPLSLHFSSLCTLGFLSRHDKYGFFPNLGNSQPSFPSQIPLYQTLHLLHMISSFFSGRRIRRSSFQAAARSPKFRPQRPFPPLQSRKLSIPH